MEEEVVEAIIISGSRKGQSVHLVNGLAVEEWKQEDMAAINKTLDDLNAAIDRLENRLDSAIETADRHARILNS